MHTSEFFRNVLAPAQSHPQPAFHVGGMRIVHFTSGSAWGALLTVFIAVVLIVIAIGAARNRRAQRDSE